MRMAVLDIGSNTVHLLVVDAHVGAAPVPATSFKRELRLAENLLPNGDLSRDAIAALKSMIRECLDVAEEQGCTELMAFATSAIREATNGEQILEEIAADTGIILQVLSGEEEARHTFLAVRRWYGWSSRRLLVMDIGGGSLEIAAGQDEDPSVAVSMPLGAGRLARSFLLSDPADPSEVKALRKHVRATLAAHASVLTRFGRPDHVVCTSKTFRSLARLTGAAPASAGPFVERNLSGPALRNIVPQLSSMSIQQRAELPGVSATRAHQVLAGAIVAEACFDLLGIEAAEIGPWALREGLILKRLDHI